MLATVVPPCLSPLQVLLRWLCFYCLPGILQGSAWKASPQLCTGSGKLFPDQQWVLYFPVLLSGALERCFIWCACFLFFSHGFEGLYLKTGAALL